MSGAIAMDTNERDLGGAGEWALSTGFLALLR
jgi:hypothetical protein